MTRPRKAPTLGEKLAAVLPRIRCSYCGELLSGPIHWDHPEFHAFGSDKLDPLHEPCHRKKTNGIPHIPRSGDISKIAHTKKVGKNFEAHRAKLLAKDADHQEQAEFRKGYRWPKRPFRSRPPGSTASSRKSPR